MATVSFFPFRSLIIHFINNRYHFNKFHSLSFTLALLYLTLLPSPSSDLASEESRWNNPRCTLTCVRLYNSCSDIISSSVWSTFPTTTLLIVALQTEPLVREVLIDIRDQWWSDKQITNKLNWMTIFLTSGKPLKHIVMDGNELKNVKKIWS